MTQESYIWENTGHGDSSLEPYDEDAVADWFRWLFMHDASYQGVVPGIGDELEVTNPSGTDILIGTGAAWIYGTFYWNDKPKLFPARPYNPGYIYYYRAILSKYWPTKQAFLEDLGPNVGSSPALTQTYGTRWDISLADFQISTSGIVSITDQRHFLRTNDLQVLKSPIRIGDITSKDWNAPSVDFSGDEIWVHHTTRVQVGTIEWTGGAAPSGNIAVTFPFPFAYDPVCIVQHLGTNGKIMTSIQTSTTGATIYWEDENGDNQTTLDFQWMAAGPIMGGI